MVKAIVSTKLSFDAAHLLPNYEGKCRNLHGHRWEVEVGVRGFINQDTGMVIDFSIIKQGIKPLVDLLDHNFLNTLIENPTAENLAVQILKWIKRNIKLPNTCEIYFVKVWESPTSYAEVRDE